MHHGYEYQTGLSLITDTFKINSGNNRTQHRRELAKASNFGLKMTPSYLNFGASSEKSISPIERRSILGSIQNTPKSFNSLNMDSTSPMLTTPLKKSNSKIMKVFHDRKRLSMADKENIFLNDEETVMSFDSPKGGLKKKRISLVKTSPSRNTTTLTDSSPRKLEIDTSSRDSGFEPSAKKTYPYDFDLSNQSSQPSTSKKLFHEDSIMSAGDFNVPDNEETLHDLEVEFESDIFDKCTNYEIISTDSPDIISRTSTRKIKCHNFNFGAPISDNERSTSFNTRTNTATRMLKFEDSFDMSLDDISNDMTLVSNDLNNSDISEETLQSLMSPEKRNDLSIKKNLFGTSESSFNLNSLPFDDIDLENTSNNLDELISGEIKLQTTRPVFNRSFSDTPTETNRHQLKHSNLIRPFKRPEPPLSNDLNLENAKRRKNDLWSSPGFSKPQFKPVLQRAYSESHASIMSALNRAASEPDLIGDFSRGFALPLTASKDSDLKSISSETLADLLMGRYCSSVEEFQVIDCRYPYEYNGGHISGAQNVYTKEQITSFLEKNRHFASIESGKRRILILHCEFSMERGPALYKYLRSSDRAKNLDNYPALNYPEMYLLQDGYKAFYNRFSNLCEPCAYIPMLDPKFNNQLKIFRNENQKLKKWQSADDGKRLQLQRQKSKSRLLL